MSPTLFNLAGWIGGGFLALAGALWLAWALFRDRSCGRRRCPTCWYSMEGVVGLVCPECGRDALRESRLGRTRRKWRQGAAAALIVTLGIGMAMTPMVVRHGWFSFVPISWLNAGLSLWEERARESYSAASSRVGGGGPAAGMTQLQRLLAAHHGGKLLDGRAYFSDLPASPGGSQLLGMRGNLATTIENLGREARPAVPSLLRGLESPDPFAADQCVRVLRVLVADVRGLDSRLLRIARGAGTDRTRAGALRALSPGGRGLYPFPAGGFRTRPAPAPVVMPGSVLAAARRLAMRDASPEVRVAAIELLASGNAKPENHVDLFIAALRDEYENVRQAAVHALHEVPSLQPECLAPLLRGSLDGDLPFPMTLVPIVERLSKSDPAPLLALLRSPDDATRIRTMNALIRSHRHEPRLADELVRIARTDSASGCVVYAVQTLRSRVVFHSEEIDVYRSLAEHADASVRSHAYAALAEHDPDRDRTLALLLGRVRHEPDTGARVAAIRALAGTNDSRPEVLGALESALSTHASPVTEAAKEAIERLSRQVPTAAPARRG